MDIAEVAVGTISLAGLEGAYEVQMVWRGSSGWPSDEIAGLAGQEPGASSYAGLAHLSRYCRQKHL